MFVICRARDRLEAVITERENTPAADPIGVRVRTVARVVEAGSVRSVLGYSRSLLVFVSGWPMLRFAFAPRYTWLDQGPGAGVRACHIIFAALFATVNLGVLAPETFSRFHHLKGRAYLFAVGALLIGTPLAYLMRLIFPI